MSKVTEFVRSLSWRACPIDQDGVERVAAVSVRVRWILGLLLIVETVYRSDYGMDTYLGFGALILLLASVNWYTRHRLRSGRTFTAPWIMALCMIDLMVISAAIAIHDGFDHNVCFLFYYPALAACAIIFTSLKLNVFLVTIVAIAYATISLTTGNGVDLEEVEEKQLFARIAAMYGVVVVVNMIASFERKRFNETAKRERELEQARLELSKSIHDTAAQSAYMVSLGIDTARSMAGDNNQELVNTLNATSRLSRSVIWGLRHPINMEGIYEGEEFNRALRSHITTFTNVTSVAAELTQTGAEPPLSVEAKSGLFSIAHNALTNVFRHAEAGRVSIDLNFTGPASRLSVSDDGVGLPDDYSERGHGFANMSRNAERLGGHLLVEKRGPLGGAVVSCVIPHAEQG